MKLRLKAKTLELWIRLVDALFEKRFPRVAEWILVHTTPMDY